MARDLDGAIAERSRKMLGLVTIRQLDALGASRQQRRSLVSQGILVSVGGGVFRHGAWPPSWEQRLLAAVLAAGEAAVVSHLAAAGLWRFDGIDAGAVEVSVTRGRSARAVPGVVHQCRDLVRADVGRRRGIPCTTASRTLLDIAPVVTGPQLEAALDGAERSGQVWRPHLEWRLRELRRQGRPGVGEIEALLARTDGRLLGDTWLEGEALRLLAESGLPAPRCQVRRRKAGGGIARVDLFWDDARLVVELDGHGTHATRRQRQVGAERASRLVLAGWRVVTFTYEDVVERPTYVIDSIRQHLASANGA
jgi:very-short-patch-repair endonuclease